jgi:hypothetical protein
MPNMNELLEILGADDWEGDMDALTCPCGYTIELDGRCPDGCVSPLIAGGVI